MSNDLRFYPAHHRQIAQITEQYRTTGTAEDARCTSLIHRAQETGQPIARVGLDTAITELYPPAAPAFSAEQEKILQRIIADSESRTVRFSTAAQRIRRPAVPPAEQDLHNPQAPHGPRP